MLQGRRDSRQGTNSTEISKRPLRRNEGYEKSPKFSCTKDDFMWELRNNLPHTFTYFASLGF
jgi:hypothetical protein